MSLVRLVDRNRHSLRVVVNCGSTGVWDHLRHFYCSPHAGRDQRRELTMDMPAVLWHQENIGRRDVFPDSERSC